MYLYLSLRFSMFCIHYLFALLLNMLSFLIQYNLNKVSPPLHLPIYPDLFYPHPLFFFLIRKEWASRREQQNTAKIKYTKMK